MSEKKVCTNHGTLYVQWCKICQQIVKEQDVVRSGRERLTQ